MKEKELHWKVDHKANFNKEENFLNTILLDCGVPEENIPGFMRPTVKYLHDPYKMVNMEAAVDMLHKHVWDSEGTHKILIRVDCDVDGYTSGAMMIQFIKQIDPNIEVDFLLDYEKSHGLTFSNFNSIPNGTYDLIVVPDASMKCRDAVQITKNFDFDILVLDHHLIETEYYDKEEMEWITKPEADNIRKYRANDIVEDCYTNYCTAVNCTDGEYPNPNLSGAGVVQKFIEAYMDKYEAEDYLNPEIRTDYYELASLGMIADSVDLRDLETRYYVIEGLKPKYYQNELMKEMQDKLADDMPFGRYIGSVGWKIAPLINGVIRYGEPEEQNDLFRALIGVQEDVVYQPRRKHKDDPKPPTEIHSLQKTMAREAINVKNRQDTEVRKFVKEINEKIAAEGLDKNSVLFIDGSKILTKKTITGLIANKLTNEYFRPVVIMKSKNSAEYGGSMRGYDKSNIINTKEFLEDTGLMTVMGHENAAGVLLNKADLPKIIDKCNEMMPLSDLCTVYPCGWEIKADELTRDNVEEVASNYEIFGSKVAEPMFAITGIKLNASQVMAYGENKNFIRFTYNGVSYVKKYCKAYEHDWITLRDEKTFGESKKELIIDVIGTFALDKYEDKTIPQVKIIDFGVREDTEGTAKRKAEAKVKKENTEKATTAGEIVSINDFEW